MLNISIEERLVLHETLGKRANTFLNSVLVALNALGLPESPLWHNNTLFTLPQMKDRELIKIPLQIDFAAKKKPMQMFLTAAESH